MKKYLAIAFCFFIVGILHAQYDHEAVFEGDDGVILFQKLIDSYKPATVLTYGPARDTMYGIIYNVNDSIAGIYTNHKVYLKPGEDPSTYIFKDGIPNGINAEHSYPQSKGAGNGNARSDMHHLFPSRVSANSARGSLPFSEVNDNSTDKWFYLSQEQTNKPNASSIDLYSELDNNAWEPRESVKGNIARAIMYFYTMYKPEADNADPNFFETQRETLCSWHDDDPVDELEWKRSKMIAKWQDGKANPFVLDCSLAYRTYCGEISPACIAVDLEDLPVESTFRLLTNPVRSFATFRNDNKNFNSTNGHGTLVLDAYTIRSLSSGKVIMSAKINQNLETSENYTLGLENLPAGTYIVEWIISAQSKTQRQVFKVIKL